MTHEHQPHTVIPAFAPVPRARERSNGWSAEVQRAFIEALAETGSVKSACKRVARAEVGAYLLRRHPEAGEFRAAWDAALDIGMRRIEDVAMDRALNGVEVPVYSYGKLVGSRTVYNDRLVMFMLRNRAPDRFAGGRARAMSAADKETVRKLKEQWRAEWERERAIMEGQRAHAAYASTVDKIKASHRKWFLMLSPAARAAYRAFRATEDADGRLWLFRRDDEDEATWRARIEADAGVAEAEYEEWFSPAVDRRAHNDKLLDMRAWPRDRPDDAEAGGGARGGDGEGDGGGDDRASAREPHR